jgi:hypothetical protein
MGCYAADYPLIMLNREGIGRQPDSGHGRGTVAASLKRARLVARFAEPDENQSNTFSHAW